MFDKHTLRTAVRDANFIMTGEKDVDFQIAAIAKVRPFLSEAVRKRISIGQPPQSCDALRVRRMGANKSRR